MKKITHTLSVIALSVASFGSMAAGYPTRSIEVVVPYSAGGGTDLVTRSFVDVANQYLPKSAGVVNKTGGGGAVGLTEIAMARPNGYKIGTGTVEIAMLPHLGLVGWDATSFTPIARLNAEPAAVSVSADAPWDTFEDFIAYAKENPSAVRIGNSGTGAIWHIAAEALGDASNVTFSHIPYNGANPAATALLGGHIEAVTVSPAEVVNHVDNGTIKILAVMSDKRLEKFPEVPTLKESGVDLSIETWRGLVVPNNTPENVITVLSDVAQKVTSNPDFTQTLEKMNLTPAYLPADEFQDAINKDNAFFAQTMTKLGLTN
ncbi:tripartite tricarboxylate transporter substrate binding protein [Photobacterium sp. ZSDE20]|uniref:Tripartite tricarboxylate transporter substrate binding protein n=1 Tax=Photobacterium pectinilyticum TaxID=2906793 RepID=A0ABT1N627_9GAMM|nr:tripartite tricarboxylate transporter substrate binding protein [Photobacterium sp. ZSDE20]MCQ1060200.1 tripartite tricarboxylate transporter substrate binding protein [Photobacterium sp. ZSDE20]MDD1827639.1 tripartite tricarboxylate transporter substrate binding protein [Photobacterium sp. ZSDE20]